MVNASLGILGGGVAAGEGSGDGVLVAGVVGGIGAAEADGVPIFIGGVFVTASFIPSYFALIR